MDEIIASLESLSDQLAEQAISVLRDAVSEGAVGRPATERTLTQARRAIEKAITLLRTLDDQAD